MIRKLSPPPGGRKRIWSSRRWWRDSTGARCRPDHEKLKSYELPVRQAIMRLAALLRLANAFQAKPYRTVRRLHVENGPGFLVIRVEGFSDRDPITSKLSVARRFLEFVFQRSVHILAPGTRMIAPRIVRPAKRSDAA